MKNVLITAASMLCLMAGLSRWMPAQAPGPSITAAPFNFASALGLTAATNTSVLTERGPRWIAFATAAGAQTATQAAGGAGVRHVVDCVGWSASAAAAITGANGSFVLNDGASALLTVVEGFPTTTGAGTLLAPYSQCGIGKIGTANTAMSLASGSVPANAWITVWVSGYDVQ